jgi:hypothetical protein
MGDVPDHFRAEGRAPDGQRCHRHECHRVARELIGLPLHGLTGGVEVVRRLRAALLCLLAGGQDGVAIPGQSILDAGDCTVVFHRRPDRRVDQVRVIFGQLLPHAR